MKKLLSVVLVSLVLISSTFGLGLSAGINGNFGGSLDKSDFSAKGMSNGAGAYVNLDLLLGIGLQAEANYVSSPCNIVTPNETITSYKALDIAFMPWYNLNLLIFSIGAGVGVNFAFYDQDINSVANGSQDFIPGVTFTVNGKVHLGKHFGVVVGAHGVFDVLPLIDVEDLPASYLLNNPNLTNLFRKTLYGTLGLEFRL